MIFCFVFRYVLVQEKLWAEKASRQRMWSEKADVEKFTTSLPAEHHYPVTSCSPAALRRCKWRSAVELSLSSRKPIAGVDVVVVMYSEGGCLTYSHLSDIIVCKMEIGLLPFRFYLSIFQTLAYLHTASRERSTGLNLDNKYKKKMRRMLYVIGDLRVSIVRTS